MSSALKKSDVVIMTGTAVTHHTIDTIFSFIKNGVRAMIT
jgi:uncharacterized protein (DUF4213/DUF364 family)